MTTKMMLLIGVGAVLLFGEPKKSKPTTPKAPDPVAPQTQNDWGDPGATYRPGGADYDMMADLFGTDKSSIGLGV
jgi:hypothetical protein